MADIYVPRMKSPLFYDVSRAVGDRMVSRFLDGKITEREFKQGMLNLKNITEAELWDALVDHCINQ